MEKQRCRWVNMKNPLYVIYHDREWGRPVHDDARLLEMLILECFQAGLSWECVLNKREAFRAAFDGFDRDRILAYDDARVDTLMRNPGIMRHRAKICAAISNTRVFKTIQDEFGSFDAYLHRFATDAPLLDHLSTTSPLSDALSADLRRRGMKFVGSTTIHSFLQAVGLINAHHPACFCHKIMNNL